MVTDGFLLTMGCKESLDVLGGSYIGEQSRWAIDAYRQHRVVFFEVTCYFFCPTTTGT